jgi:predicted Zn-dependent peptidase
MTHHAADGCCRREILPSGITLLTEEMPSVRSAALGIWIEAGSRDETEAEGGMAHFVEHLLFKGTDRRDTGRIAREVDALGGQMDAFTSREYTCFFITVLDDRLAQASDILADIFLNSTFPEREIALERGVVLEEIRMSQDNPEDNLQELTIASVWGAHPLARSILGRPETVGSFSREDVLSFFRRHYHGGRAFVACAGNVQHDRVRDLVARDFGGAAAGPPAGEDPPPRFSSGVVRHEKPLNQVYIDINLPGISQTHPLRYPVHVLNAILGGSLSSRLFQRIREERGLVYSIYSGLSSFGDSGLLHLSASTGPALAAEVTQRMVDELQVLRRERPDAEELRRAKDHLIGNVVLSMESSSNRLNKLGKQEIYYRRRVSLEETIQAIEAVDEAALEEASLLLLGRGEIAFGFLGPAQGIPDDGALPSW